MKKLLAIFTLLFSVVLMNAQSDTLSMKTAKTDTTFIHLGQLRILVIDDNDDGVGEDDQDGNDQLQITLNSKGDTICAPRESTKSDLAHWGGIDLGMNILMDAKQNTSFSDENEWLNLDYGHSFSWNFNFYEQKIRLAKDYVGIITGVGLNFRKFGFRDSVQLTSTADTTMGMFNSDVTFRTNKLRTTSVTVPLLLEFNTNKDHRKSFHLAAGVTGSWILASAYKQKYDEDGKTVKGKLREDFNINRLSLDATARIGYGNFTLFANYALTPFFEDGKGPELYPLTVGLQLVGW